MTVGLSSVDDGNFWRFVWLILRKRPRQNQQFTTNMGNSPSSGQGGIETHDSRDIDGTGLKYERPYEFTNLATGKTKISDITCNITWRYVTPCLPVVDCKINDLE